jgi:hypothetical protein
MGERGAQVPAEMQRCRDAVSVSVSVSVSARGRVEQHVVRSQIGRRGHTGQAIRAGCCELGCWAWCAPNRARPAVEADTDTDTETQSWPNPTSAVRAAALSCSVRGRGHTVIVCKCNAVGGRGDNGRAPGDGLRCAVGEGDQSAGGSASRDAVRASGRQAGRQAGRTERRVFVRTKHQVLCHHTRQQQTRHAAICSSPGWPCCSAIYPIIRGPGE